MPRREVVVLAALALVFFACVSPGRAAAPPVVAIQGARIVPVSGAPIAKGTVVLRDGRIAAVGDGVSVPADAQVIDGTGLVIYPGLFDVGTEIGITPPAEPGNVANLVVTEGDLPEIRTPVRHRFIRGRPVPLDSKHTRLYERSMGRP